MGGPLTFTVGRTGQSGGLGADDIMLCVIVCGCILSEETI